MTESKKCPYCNVVYPLFHQDGKNAEKNSGTQNDYFFDINLFTPIPVDFKNQYYHLIITKCPNCHFDTISIEESIEGDIRKQTYQVKPNAIFTSFPDYIPLNIRNDYEEACAIIQLSPKASATLARRCLQGMIRDFWGIKKDRLIDEIKSLKDIVPTHQWKAIDALRSLGNIGAHMENDVNFIIDIDDGEAEKIIKLIELLITQWYIDRHEQETLYSDLIDISQEKKEQKKSTGKKPAQL